jgi:hypothetical protein
LARNPSIFPSNGLVIKDDIYCHLSPAGLGRIHREGEGIARLGSSGRVLVGNLKEELIKEMASRDFRLWVTLNRFHLSL